MELDTLYFRLTISLILFSAFQGCLGNIRSLAGLNGSAKGIAFHQVHGKDIVLSERDTIATRTTSYCLGITFTNRAVKVNERIFVKILKRNSMWAGHLYVGFTASNPMQLPFFMNRCQYPFQINDQTWARKIEYLSSMENSVFFFYVSDNGTVIQGDKNGEKELLSGIDTTTDLWAVFHVYGQTIAIQLLEISCPSNFCKNGGKCEKDNEINILNCICPHGYTGEVCEAKIFCKYGLCQNGGSCTQEGPNGVYQCSCARGYKGLSCEEEINTFSGLMLVYLDVIVAVVGVVLLIIGILAAVKFFRSKKEEVMEEEQHSYSEQLNPETND